MSIAFRKRKRAIPIVLFQILSLSSHVISSPFPTSLSWNQIKINPAIKKLHLERCSLYLFIGLSYSVGSTGSSVELTSSASAPCCLIAALKSSTACSIASLTPRRGGSMVTPSPSLRQWFS